MTKDTLLFVLSDTHCGHKLGLINPETTIFDESTGKEIALNLTEVQKYLWELYLYTIQEAQRLSKGMDIVVLMLGDITHGIKYPEQLISTRMADQITIVQQMLKPLLALKNVKAVRMVFGTGSHDLGEGSSMLILKGQLSPSFPKTDIGVITHGLLNIKNHLIDYAHHGPGTGIRDWLNGNEVRFYLRNIIYREIKSGNQIPDLVLRGHVHGFSHESIHWIEKDELKKSSITIVPSMCGMSEFARQGGRSGHLLSNGIVMYHINNIVSDPIPIIRTLDVRIKEEL